MPYDLKNWIVLVVDDERDNLEIAARIFSFNGATVHTARHGEEGLEVLRDIQPTLILMDLSMPRMSGWDMFKVVRANPKTAHIPILAVTAHVTADIRDRVKEVGFDGYLTKPFGITSLMEEARRAVSLNTNIEPVPSPGNPGSPGISVHQTGTTGNGSIAG
ncbi:MAG: response regulator [Anaerolineae bacterium]|nr:response regulator [Anaerolineae bacterium]